MLLCFAFCSQIVRPCRIARSTSTARCDETVITQAITLDLCGILVGKKYRSERKLGFVQIFFIDKSILFRTAGNGQHANCHNSNNAARNVVHECTDGSHTTQL